jgi:hypothetical protein
MAQFRRRVREWEVAAKCWLESGEGENEMIAAEAEFLPQFAE